MSRDAVLFGLVGAWYEAATDIGKWPALLERLCAFFAAEKAQLFGLDLVRNQAWVSVGYNTDQTLIDEFSALVPHDPRSAFVMAHPGKPFSCRLHVGEAELHASRMYREFLSRPATDMEFTLGFMEELEPAATLGLSINRGRAGRAFTQQDCDDLGRMLPHFRNAAHVMRQLEAARSASTAMAETLDRISVPIALVDRVGHVAVANRAARELAARGAISLRHGQLWADRAEESRRLRAAIAEVIDAPEAAPRALALLPLRAPPLAVHIAPVPGVAGDSATRALVHFVDPAARHETASQVLRRLYGLTHAEAGLLAGILDGLRVAEIAAARGTSGETVRTQLKAIYRKTGAVDQADLVRIVAGHPELVRNGIAPQPAVMPPRP